MIRRFAVGACPRRAKDQVRGVEVRRRPTGDSHRSRAAVREWKRTVPSGGPSRTTRLSASSRSAICRRQILARCMDLTARANPPWTAESHQNHLLLRMRVGKPRTRRRASSSSRKPPGGRSSPGTAGKAEGDRAARRAASWNSSSTSRGTSASNASPSKEGVDEPRKAREESRVGFKGASNFGTERRRLRPRHRRRRPQERRERLTVAVDSSGKLHGGRSTGAIGGVEAPS